MVVWTRTNLGRHDHAKNESEDGMVAQGTHLLEFPENRLGVPVVVLSQRNVLDTRLRRLLQQCNKLNMKSTSKVGIHV